RFVVSPAAMQLASPASGLTQFSGQMLKNPGVEVVTSAALATGANSTNLVLNNPTGATLANAKQFLEFVNDAGAVVREVSTTTTLPPGPSVVPVNWSTADFSPAYDATKDYI